MNVKAGTSFTLKDIQDLYKIKGKRVLNIPLSTWNNTPDSNKNILNELVKKGKITIKVNRIRDIITYKQKASIKKCKTKQELIKICDKQKINYLSALRYFN